MEALIIVPDDKPRKPRFRPKVADVLTPEQARVIYTALHNAATPTVGPDVFSAALKKLVQVGGGVHCRKCLSLGEYPSHTGEKVCAQHKDK